MRIDEHDKMPYVWETISTMIFQSTPRFSEEKGSTIYTNSLKHHWYGFTRGFLHLLQRKNVGKIWVNAFHIFPSEFLLKKLIHPVALTMQRSSGCVLTIACHLERFDHICGVEFSTWPKVVTKFVVFIFDVFVVYPMFYKMALDEFVVSFFLQDQTKEKTWNN